MAIYTTEAIIIGSKNWGEADKMLQFFSRERGKFKAVAFGCRRSKSPLAGAMQMFNVVNVSLASGERIDTVRQVSRVRHLSSVESDLMAISYASFVAELVSEIEPEGVPSEEVYDLLPSVFAATGEHNPRIVSLAAGYQLLSLAGVGFSYDKCVVCGEAIAGDALFSIDEGGAVDKKCAGDLPRLYAYPETTRQLLLTLVSLDWAHPAPFTVKRSDLTQAETILYDDIRQMTGHELKSIKFIRQMS